MNASGSIDAAVVAAWEAALAAYSHALDGHRALLLAIEADRAAEHGAEHEPDFGAGSALPAFAAPDHLEPLPESLLPWARQLLEQTNGLVQLAGDLADRSARAVTSRPPASRHRPVHTDAGASTWDTLL